MLLSSYPDASEYIQSIPTLVVRGLPSDLPRYVYGLVLAVLLLTFTVNIYVGQNGWLQSVPYVCVCRIHT